MASILTRGQRRLLAVLVGLAVYVLANSAYLFLADPGPDLTVFYQVMLLSHLVGGFLLLLTATVFLVWHLGRVARLWHWSAASSGAGLVLIAYLLFFSGLFILYESNSREHIWVFYAHRILAVLAPLTYAAHRLVSHFPPARRPVRVGLVALLILFLAMVGVSHLGGRPPAAVAPAPRGSLIPFVAANYPDASSPFFPASTTTDSGGFFPARIITRDERGDFERIRKDVEKLGFAADTTIGAETCRRCHPDIVAQWEASAHRFASFNNPFYRAAVEKVRETVGKRRSQFCAGCHDPSIMLAGNMTNEIDPLTPESQAGLTCLACHAIERIHGVTGNGNYHIADKKPSPYLGDGASSGPLRFLADQMTKSKPTAHKRLLKKPFFGSAAFCAACHKVSLDVPLNSYRYLRGQDEYDAWHDSGVSMNAARTFYLPGRPRTCRDCHMPREEAPLGDVSAKQGKVRSHRFLAVNTALPYLRGDFDTIRRAEAFLQADKLRIDVFALQYADGTRVYALDRTRPAVVPGEEVVFEVVVRNKGVGHTFPGGTNDSNQGWIDFRITDASGRELYRSGAVDEKGYVDETAHFYRVVMVRHDGTEADERDAQNFHVAAFARAIGPGTADVARYGFTVPEDLSGELVVEAKLNWRKFNRGYTEFVFRDRGLPVPDLPHLKRAGIPDLPVTTIASSAVTLAVRASRGAPPPPVADPAVWERFNDHGIASLLQGAFDVAEASFREVARLRPDLPDGWRNEARRWIVSASPKRAEPLLQKMDEVAPRDPQRPYFWGRYFERIEEYARAAEAYEASLQVFPHDRDGWRHLGAVRYKLHEYEASLEAYLKVLEIDDEDIEAHKRRRDIYRQLGREREAAEAQKAFDKYRKDDHAQEVAREFLLRHDVINREAQPRHVHR